MQVHRISIKLILIGIKNTSTKKTVLYNSEKLESCRRDYSFFVGYTFDLS